MLHLIPAPIHRRLYRLADKVRRRWWTIRRPRRNSVIVAAFDEAGRVLLVRHSYGPPVWALPGGSMNRREEPAAAAEREFREELGCPLDNIVLLSELTQNESGSADRLHVFMAQVAGTPKADMREILAADFFDPERLPRPADHRVPRLVGEAAAARGDPGSEQR